MRVWDIPPKRLCRKHLLGEHREVHAVWTVLTKNKKGYSRHPETLRWKGKLKALFMRHEILVKEMLHRGYRHNSPLDRSIAKGKEKQVIFIDRPARQKTILTKKDCDCLL